MTGNKTYSGDYISLYDHLGHAAGNELGQAVAYAAAKAGVKHQIRKLKTSYYTGDIYTYPSEFLNEYFGTKTPEPTKYPKGSLLNELPPSDYQMGN